MCSNLAKYKYEISLMGNYAQHEGSLSQASDEVLTLYKIVPSSSIRAIGRVKRQPIFVF